MCNVYFVQVLDNQTRLIPDNDLNELSNNQQMSSINLKPVMKYLYKNGKLETLLNNKDGLSDEVLENRLG